MKRRASVPISGRVRTIKEGEITSGPVVYWMSRDQRATDNWALIYASQIASDRKLTLKVVFCLVDKFLGATPRQYGFMLEGLAETEKELAGLNIPFEVIIGNPVEKIPGYIYKTRAACLVTDFDPLRIKVKWKNGVSSSIKIPFFEVDAHNIVPCWLASPKQEFGAYTIRPKISRMLNQYLVKFPALKPHPYNKHKEKKLTDWKKIKSIAGIDNNSTVFTGFKPGARQANKLLDIFISDKIKNYSSNKNDPNKNVLSNISPYLHFGQIASQTAALVMIKNKVSGGSAEAFLEELIIRKELSDNFCFYNRYYDSFNCLPEWSKKTLRQHCLDKRPYLYSTGQLENAGTHDKLWNAAQTEMVKTGKMHGYLRMYWAKKILEWTASPEEAIDKAVYLNDKYELDGRDPNGYAGIMWSIGGLHDRAWPERAVFGKIRYMNYEGCKRKFDIEEYVARIKLLR